MRRHVTKSAFGSFGKCDRGLAALELALYAPVLCFLMLGGFDLARFISIRAGVDKVGFSVADVTAQYDELTPKAMEEIFKITGSTLTAYKSGSNGLTVLSSLYLDTAAKKAKVRWQCASSASTQFPSKIGVAGGDAAIDKALLADGNDNVMVAEVFYKFKPVLSAFFKGDFTIYTSSTYRPRLGALTTKPCT